MKKRTYHVCTFALMSLMLSTANAQSLFNAKRHYQQESFSVSKNKEKQKKLSVSTFVAPSQLLKASVQEIEASTEEKTVPTSYTQTVGSTLLSEKKVTYDKKGRIIEISSEDGTGTKYSYTDNEKGKWTTRTQSTWAKNTNGIIIESERVKTERTFDSKGRIITIEKSSYNFSKDVWEPSHSYAYDYDHVGIDQDAISNGEAVITKDISYSVSTFRYKEGYEYIWIEPIKSYVKSSFNLGYTNQYQFQDNTLSWSEIHYDYNTNEVKSAQYYKEEIQEGKPQVGYYTSIASQSDDNKNWTITDKIEFTANYNDLFLHNDGKQRILVSYNYDADTQQFELDRKIIREWVSHPTLKLIKETDIDGDEDTYIQYLTVYDNGKLKFNSSEDFYLSPNGDYVTYYYTRSKTDNTYTDYYTFYNAQGIETRRVRMIETTDISCVAPNILEEQKNGEWTPIKNETLNMGDLTNIFNIKTNELGYPIWSEEYIDGKLDMEYKAEYSNTGYTIFYYDLNEYTQQKYLDEKVVCTLSADGSRETISTEYLEDGTIDYRSKEICKAVGDDKITYHYSWDEEKANWSTEPTISVARKISEAADGAITTIDRSYENGEVVNYMKTVEKPYDIPAIHITLPSNPLPGGISDIFFTDIHLYEAVSGNTSTTYFWNKDTQQWEADNSDNKAGYEYKYVEDKLGNDAPTGYHVSLGYDKFDYIVDSQNRLTAYSDNYHSYTYKYNDDGCLIQIMDISADDPAKYEVYAINYGKIQVTVTDGISQPTAQTIHLQVNGRTITLSDANSHAQSGKSLQLFSLDGKLVGKSQAGSVTAPAAGIYVVVADGVKTKISVK